MLIILFILMRIIVFFVCSTATTILSDNHSRYMVAAMPALTLIRAARYCFELCVGVLFLGQG